MQHNNTFRFSCIFGKWGIIHSTQVEEAFSWEEVALAALQVKTSLCIVFGGVQRTLVRAVLCEPVFFFSKGRSSGPPITNRIWAVNRQPESVDHSTTVDAPLTSVFTVEQ
jgi:hypothetical protein